MASQLATVSAFVEGAPPGEVSQAHSPTQAMLTSMKLADVIAGTNPLLESRVAVSMLKRRK